MRAIRKARNSLRPNTSTTSSVAAIAVMAVAGCQSPGPDPVVQKLKPVAKEADLFRREPRPLTPNIHLLREVPLETLAKLFGEPRTSSEPASHKYTFEYAPGFHFTIWGLGQNLRSADIELHHKVEDPSAAARQIGLFRIGEPDQVSEKAVWNGPQGTLPFRHLLAFKSDDDPENYNRVGIEFFSSAQQASRFQTSRTETEIPQFQVIKHLIPEYLSKLYKKTEDVKFTAAGDCYTYEYAVGKELKVWFSGNSLWRVHIQFPDGITKWTEASKLVGFDEKLHGQTYRFSATRKSDKAARLKPSEPYPDSTRPLEWAVITLRHDRK